MKTTILNYLIIGVLSYYLVKGIMFLFFWNSLVKLEERGLERVARRKEAMAKRRQKYNNT